MKKVLFTFILLLSVLVLAPFKLTYAAVLLNNEQITLPAQTSTDGKTKPYITVLKYNSNGTTNWQYWVYYSSKPLKLIEIVPKPADGNTAWKVIPAVQDGTELYYESKFNNNLTTWTNNVTNGVFTSTTANISSFSVYGQKDFYVLPQTNYSFANSSGTVIYDGTPQPTQEDLLNGNYSEGIYFYEPKGSQNFIKSMTYNGKIYFDVPITYNSLGVAAPLDTLKENLISYFNNNLKTKFDFYLKDSNSNIIPMNISITGLSVTTTFNDNDPLTVDKYRGYLDFKFSINNTGNFTIVSKMNAPSNLKNTFIPLYQWFTWETVSYKMYETTRAISVSENILDSNNDGKDDTSGNIIVIPPAPTPTPSGNTTTTTETGSGTTITITNTNNVSSSSSSGGGTGSTQPTIDSAQAVSNFTQVGGYFTAFSGFLGEIISFLPLEVKALIIAAAGIIFVICIKKAILA